MATTTGVVTESESNSPAVGDGAPYASPILLWFHWSPAILLLSYGTKLPNLLRRHDGNHINFHSGTDRDQSCKYTRACNFRREIPFHDLVHGLKIR